MLVGGKISYFWMQVNFWRSFCAITLHYVCVLCLLSLCRLQGFFRNIELHQKMEDILDRPSDDTVDIFSKIKQPIFMRALAFNKHNKDRHKVKMC